MCDIQESNGILVQRTCDDPNCPDKTKTPPTEPN